MVEDGLLTLLAHETRDFARPQTLMDKYRDSSAAAASPARIAGSSSLA